jgi:hypothetical protein
MAWFAIVARSRDQRIGKIPVFFHLIARRLTRSDPRWFRSSKPRSQRRGCARVTGRRATIDKQLARSEKPAKPVFV